MISVLWELTVERGRHMAKELQSGVISFVIKRSMGYTKSSVEMHRLIIACRPEEAWRRRE